MGKVVTLGEIMLRLSTEAGERIASVDHMSVHYGGGEANVAISLANYGHDVYFASKVPDNSLGTACLKHLQAFNVKTDYLLKGGKRLGSYYMEAGIGERAASVIYDRAGSSFATMEENEWPEDLFSGKDIFHISGITAALSPKWHELTLKLIQKAKENQVKISFDVNYRSMLWSQSEAGEFLQKVLPLVDYLSAGKMDALYLLKVAPFTGEENSAEELIYYYEKMQELFPNISVFYSTKRKVHSASDNELTGTLFTNGQYYVSQTHRINPIVDRVGGGDAFSGGVLHGILSELSMQDTINFACAASSLKHTVYGDCNQFSTQEVQAFLKAGSGKIIR